MDAVLFITIMGILSTFYLFLGWSASKRMKDHVDFFFAGKELGIFATTATLLATQVGGGMFIGTSQDPFRGILYVIGIIISFVILGLGVAEKFRAFNVETVAGIFEKQYKSPLLSKISAVLAVITLCGILLSQSVAMQSVISNFSGPYSAHLFPILWAVIIVYTLLGGLSAIVAVDLAQVGFVILMFLGFFLYGLWTDKIAFFSQAGINQMTQVFNDANLPVLEIIRILLISTCYSVITQDIAHRFFAAKNKKIAGQAAIYAGIALLSFAIVPFYFGIKAQFIPDLAQHHSPLYAALSQIGSGVPLVLAMCALMAAITSTVDSLLCAVASIICALSASLIKYKKYEVRASQLIILICGLVIFFGSFIVPKNVINILIDSYEVSVVCVFVPIIAACIRPKKDLSIYAAYLSVGLGFFGFCFSRLYTASWFGPWGLLFSMSLSIGGYIIGDMIQPKKKKKITA